MLLDENLTADALAAYRVVVLPNVAILGEEEVNLFAAYVRGGGNLVVTGQTGCYTTSGAPAGETVLAELLGARLKEMLPDRDNYVRLDTPPDALAGIAGGVPLDWPHLVYGPAVVYEPATATAWGELVAPVRRQRQKEGKEGTAFPSSADAPVGPGVLLNSFGKGRVLTFAAAPGAAVGSEYRTTEARRLLSNAVAMLRGQPDVEVVEAPQYVDTVFTDDPREKTLRVHFVACVSPPGITEPKRPWVLPEPMEDTPLYRAVVRVRRPIVTCNTLDENTRLERQGTDVLLTVNNVHETLVIEYD